MDIRLDYYAALSGRILDLSYLYTRGVAIGLKYAALTGHILELAESFISNIKHKICSILVSRINYRNFSVKFENWFYNNSRLVMQKPNSNFRKECKSGAKNIVMLIYNTLTGRMAFIPETLSQISTFRVVSNR